MITAKTNHNQKWLKLLGESAPFNLTMNNYSSLNPYWLSAGYILSPLPSNHNALAEINQLYVLKFFVEWQGRQGKEPQNDQRLRERRAKDD